MTTGDYKVGYKKPPVGKKFEKGKSGNPGGITKVARELMEARKVSKQTFEEKLQTFLRMPMVDLEAMMKTYKEEGVVCLDMLVGSIITKAIMEGCVSRMNFLLNRMGVNAEFVEHDPTLNVSTEQAPAMEEAPFYVVEINQGGKFLRARPRQLLLEERQETQPKTANG